LESKPILFQNLSEKKLIEFETANKLNLIEFKTLDYIFNEIPIYKKIVEQIAENLIEEYIKQLNEIENSTN